MRHPMRERDAMGEAKPTGGSDVPNRAADWLDQYAAASGTGKTAPKNALILDQASDSAAAS